MGKDHSYKDILGYVRIDGSDIEAGLVDIQSIKHTIEGTDKAIRHFLRKQNSDIGDVSSLNYTIKTRSGCWELLIPIGAVLGFTAGTYVNSAVKELAKNDVGNRTTKDIFVRALQSTQHVIQIAKHLGTMKNKRELSAKVIDAEHIIIWNTAGEELTVTKQQLEDYQSAPKDLLTELSYPAVEDRSVKIGYIENSNRVEQFIRAKDRPVFYTEGDEKEELFPELRHGTLVELEGSVTRGNQRTNTIGFEYKGHIITCQPVNKYVSNYLEAHYKRCRIRGMISRLNESDKPDEHTGRLRIYFTDLDIIRDTSTQQELFET